MKLLSRASSAFLALFLAACSASPVADSEVSQKIYVAAEGEGHIAVLNPVTGSVMKTVDLSEQADGIDREFAPHNVQVAPDGKTVWVTANLSHSEEGGGHEENGEHGSGNEHGDENTMPDQVIVIDPHTDTIIRRIPLDTGAHLAHVVVAEDGSFAYATAQEKNTIYKIDARRLELVKEVMVSEGSEPHGLRISSDGKTAYVALLGGKAVGVLDLAKDTVTTIPLEGNAVQTAVTPDGKWAAVSLYDTKQIALVETATKEVSYIELPEESKGPIQLYPTPDSRFLYVADQGYYFEQPTGKTVYKIDLLSRSVVKDIPAGDAPHGVVVSPDGKEVYVTNLLSNDVSVINTSTDAEIRRIEVGKMPNGISIWQESSGGTP